MNVKELWKNNERPVVVYLHNPFCRGEHNCSYCCHAGSPLSEHTKEEVNNFYFSYMPKLFNYYEDVLNSQDVKLVDFGGGTPNYLEAKDFDKYCELLPEKLKSIPKIIELNPAYLESDFLDVLKKYHFTTLIFCFQTFNEKILTNQNRKSYNLEKIKFLFDYARVLGFNIATDLITYWTKTDFDWKVLDNDLKILRRLNPDEITISPLYQNKYNQEYNGNLVGSKIRRVFDNYFPEYENPENTLTSNYQTVCIRFYNPKSEIRKDFDIYIHSLTGVTWEFEEGYSTLGMGTYKNKFGKVFSAIGPNYTIYEEFKDFNSLPELNLKKNWNFWEEIRKRTYELEKFGNPPVASTFSFTNICPNENMFFEDFKQGNLPYKFMPRFSGEKSEIEETIERDYLKKIN